MSLDQGELEARAHLWADSDLAEMRQGLLLLAPEKKPCVCVDDDKGECIVNILQVAWLQNSVVIFEPGFLPDYETG